MTRCFLLFSAVFRCFFWNSLCTTRSKTRAAENSAFQRKTAEENSMKDIATLALPAGTLCRLLQYVEASPGEASAGELAALAIEEWLTRGELGKGPAIRHRGYQWKTVFLPEGTQLRAWNRTGFAYAEVLGDSIMYQGERVSPHAFICRCKGISRSAWAEVALLFPHENNWKRADAYRRELERMPVLRTAPAQTLAPPLPAQTPAGFSTVLPPTTAPAPARHSRLPRVPPIPTQARHQPASTASTAAARDIPTLDRRQRYRRQEDAPPD
ncbi:hypothetical protein [Pseudoduganella sp. R-34]|uniref:hypothetical protein n=1 Tax=Pseudoduganella sp. R-34 TaxID=3404062 RepID=UPI003CEA8218